MISASSLSKNISSIINAFEIALSDEYILAINFNGVVYILGNIDSEDLQYWINEKIVNNTYHRDQILKLIEAVNATPKGQKSRDENIQILLNRSFVDKIKLCLVNNELIYDITIDVSPIFSATINLTSAYLGKSSYYGLYKIEEIQGNGMFTIISQFG